MIRPPYVIMFRLIPSNNRDKLLAFVSLASCLLLYLAYTCQTFTNSSVAHISYQKRLVQTGLASQEFTTVVCMFFSLASSKHPSSSYSVWVKNMLLSVESPLVIFTDNASLNYLQATRNASKFTNQTLRTTFLVYDSIWDIMRELEHRRNMSYIWRYQNEQHAKDPEMHIHNPSLYAIWNLKTFLLTKAAEQNPYHSEFFIYTDAGAWRQTAIPHWPDNAFVLNVSRVLNERILLGQISQIDEERATNISIYNDCIEGGFLAGSKKAIDNFHHIFYDLHDQRLNDGLFIGKDQTMMNKLALITHRDQIVRLKAWDVSCADPWFFYQLFFARLEYYACAGRSDRLSRLIKT